MEKLEKEATMDFNLVSVGECFLVVKGVSVVRLLVFLDEIFDVEWWDWDILCNGMYDDVMGGKWNVNMDKFNVYVEYFVLIKLFLNVFVLVL